MKDFSVQHKKIALIIDSMFSCLNKYFKNNIIYYAIQKLNSDFYGIVDLMKRKVSIVIGSQEINLNV